jgi:serine/threonine protein kinase
MGELEPPSRPSAGYAATIQRSGKSGDSEPAYAEGTLLAGRYRVVRLLGEGGMGSVYEAEHLALGRRVAVKVMRRRYADQRAMVERFGVEARSASKIAHPNVVQVFDYGTTEAGEGFLVMELLEGVPLSDVVRKQGPLELARVISILAEVATALRAAHQSGIIHRDLKPANIFLTKLNADERERVRVLDFGMAKLIDLGANSDAGDSGQTMNRGLTAAGEILGTPEYMAPEQAIGGEVDARIDVYALGCVAFEMWTGGPPFTGSNYVTVLAKHMDERAPRLSDTRDAPPALDQLVARTLSKLPDDRPADMGAVLQALARVAEDEGVLASTSPSLPSLVSLPSVSPSSARMPSGRRGVLGLKRRARKRIVMGAAVVGCLVAGAVLGRIFGPPPPPVGPGTLVIATTPAGATIKVDGQELDERSPAVARLTPGAHDVEAVMPHYLSAQRARLAVKAASSEIVRIPLTRDVYKVNVSSEPAGAQIYLDGYAVGTTPMELEVDPWDQHTLRLERLGRRAWEKLLPAGDRQRELHAELKKREAGDVDE